MDESRFDAVVFVNGHSNLFRSEMEQLIPLEGIRQTTVCLAEVGMPAYAPNKFIWHFLPTVMKDAFSIPPTELCRHTISHVLNSVDEEDEYLRGRIEKNGFAHSKGMCSKIPTEIRNREWAIKLEESTDCVTGGCDGVYLLPYSNVIEYNEILKDYDTSSPLAKEILERTITPERILDPKPEDVRFTPSMGNYYIVSKKMLMDELKELGFENVLIIDAGCNKIKGTGLGELQQKIEEGSFGGTKRKRKRKRKTRRY